MPASNVILESHHVIENTIFRKHDLLRKLAEHDLIDKDVSTNRLYLPVDGKLADELETSPTEDAREGLIRMQLWIILTISVTPPTAAPSWAMTLLH